MKRFLMFVALLAGMAVGAIAEDRPILFVTPKGVFLSTVTNGVPGPFVLLQYDVIVQGGGVASPGPTPTPDPLPNDPIVAQIKTISITELKDQREATAVAAICNSLAKMGLSGPNFKQALEMAAPIADTSLQAGGRITKWAKAATAVTSDPVKLVAGLTAAFSVLPSAVDAIHAAAVADPGAAVSGEALDWAQITEVIKMILALLKSLGII